MTEAWEQNEELSEEQDLAASGHRDDESPVLDPEEEQAVETTADDPRQALEELGEDVSSSPARRAD